jgi:hypothetical protein
LLVGSPVTTIVGKSTLAVPINKIVAVILQPASSTIASIGLPQIDSSISTLARFRVNIGGRSQVRFGVENTRNFTEIASFKDAALDVFGQLADVRGINIEQNSSMVGRPAHVGRLAQRADGRDASMLKSALVQITDVGKLG